MAMTTTRRFPANELTWDNYRWAVRKAARWTLVWDWTYLRLSDACKALRADVPLDEGPTLRASAGLE